MVTIIEQKRHVEAAREKQPIDNLTPAFDIYISGKDMSKITPIGSRLLDLLVSIEYEDDVKMSSLLTMHLKNRADTQPDKFADWSAVLESLAFQEGNYVDLYLGYGNLREFVDRCEILKWMPNFDADGQTLTIKAQDGRHRLQSSHRARFKNIGRKKRQTVWKGLSDADIVRKIAAKYQYKADVDPTEINKKTAIKVVAPPIGSPVGTKPKLTPQSVIPNRIQKAGQTDWEFLQHLAKIQDFDLWVDFQKSNDPAAPIEGGAYVVHFKKKKEAGEEIGYLFKYGGDNPSILNASPEFSIKDKPTGVEVLHYDKSTRKIKATTIEDTTKTEIMRLDGPKVGPNSLRAKDEILHGARVRFTAFGRSITAIADKPFYSKQDALDFVDKFLRENERDFIMLRMTVVGVPSLRSRQVHAVEGLSSRLDGFYKITNCKHTMSPDGIYVCEVTGYKLLTAEIIPKKTGKGSSGGILITKWNRVQRFGAKDGLGIPPAIPPVGKK